MNQYERAQRMVALLTQAFKSGCGAGNSKGEINIFEGDIVARIELPDVDNSAPRETYARCGGDHGSPACAAEQGADVNRGWRR